MVQFFIGLDLSLNGSGIVVLQEDDVGLRCIFAKKLVPKGVFGTARLAWLADAFSVITSASFTRPGTFVAVEDYAMRGSGRVASLAEWAGIAKLHVYRCGLPMLIINNSTLKAYAGGKEKPEVAAGVKRLCAARKLEVDFGKDYDLWDACGLALMLQYPLSFVVFWLRSFWFFFGLAIPYNVVGPAAAQAARILNTWRSRPFHVNKYVAPLY